MLQSSGGKIAAVLILAAGAAAIFFSMRRYAGGSSAASLARQRTFICEKTGKSFQYELKEGDQIPVKSPFSGEKTAYPAELCYWTREGGVKAEPTAVLLATYRNQRGPTFCSDCGRLVVGHNPPAAEGGKAPPTKEEYDRRRPSE
jgi:hypothetical protein